MKDMDKFKQNELKGYVITIACIFGILLMVFLTVVLPIIWFGDRYVIFPIFLLILFPCLLLYESFKDWLDRQKNRRKEKC